MPDGERIFSFSLPIFYLFLQIRSTHIREGNPFLVHLLKHYARNPLLDTLRHKQNTWACCSSVKMTEKITWCTEVFRCQLWDKRWFIPTIPSVFISHCWIRTQGKTLRGRRGVMYLPLLPVQWDLPWRDAQHRRRAPCLGIHCYYFYLSPSVPLSVNHPRMSLQSSYPENKLITHPTILLLLQHQYHNLGVKLLKSGHFSSCCGVSNL